MAAATTNGDDLKMVPNDKIQLYTLGTPNGWKIQILLEELNLPYESHTIDISKGEQFSPEFVKINPNSKIPAVVDPNGPDGKPFNIFESGAILLYFAEKTGKFIPADPVKKWQTIQWLFFQMAGIGPMFGQFGHFYKFAKEKIPYAIDRYATEVRRLLKVLDQQLEGKQYVIGDEYTIADIAIWGWVHALSTRIDAPDLLKLNEFANVNSWAARVGERPAVKRGIV